MEKVIKVCLSPGGFFIHAEQGNKNHLLIQVNSRNHADNIDSETTNILNELSKKGKRIRTVDINSDERHKILHRFRPDYFYLYSDGSSEIKSKSHALFAKMLLLCGDNGIAIMVADNNEDVVCKLNSLLYPRVLM